MEEFLRRRVVLKELRRTVASWRNGRKSFVIKFDQLLKHDIELAKNLIDDPTEFFINANKILEDITKTPDVRLRVRDLDKSMKADEIRAKDIGRFIGVEGTVTYAGELRLIGEEDGDVYQDYQRIRINGLDVDLTEDLVGEVNEGNRIVATGTLGAIKVDSEIAPENQFKKLLMANSIVLPDKEECESRGGHWDGVSCVAPARPII